MCIMEVWLADMSTFLRFAVVRAHALSPLCVRFRHFDRVRPAPQLEPSHLVPAGSHYSQVPDVGLGHSRRRRKMPRLLRSALLHKPLHSAHSRSGPPACWQRRSYEVSNRTGRAPRTRPDEHVTLPPTSCCQSSKCRTSHMMRPLPPPKVIGQPSQAGWPRPGRQTASAGTLSGSPFPPDWRQIALGQVHTAAPPCSTLPIRDVKAGHLLSDREQELSSTVFQHVRAPCPRPCKGFRDCTHDQRLPIYTGAFTSQRLFVVFHTAYPKGDLCHPPRPSSNRPGGSPNTFGCRALRPQGPSRRPAKKLKHATIVANRAGEANTQVSKDAERALRQATSGKHGPGIKAGTPHTSRIAGMLTRPAARLTTGTNGPQQPPRPHGGGRESKSTRSRWRPGPTRRKTDGLELIPRPPRARWTHTWPSLLPRQ